MQLSDKLKDTGLTPFWLGYIILHALLSASLLFVTDDFAINISNALLTTLVSIGVIAGYIYHRHKLYPWGFLLSSVILVGIAIIMKSLWYFDFRMETSISFWIELVGIILGTVFAFSYMILFENKFNIKGFTLDFSLLFFSVSSFILLVTPDLLDVFLHEFNFYQQLLLIKIFISLLLLSMAIIHITISRAFELKNLSLLLSILFLTLHFITEAIVSLRLVDDINLINRISWATYQLTGTSIILFTFTEDLSLNFHYHTSNRIADRFKWIASVLAIMVIPVGLMIRWLQDMPSINPVIIGLTSFILSGTVILRLIFLIWNSNQQREKLQSIAFTNSLTNLPNYLGFIEQLSAIRHTNILVVGIDIDDFKSINDLYGRNFGDEVLKSLGSRIAKLPNSLLVAHTGSDSFLIAFQTNKNDIPQLLNSIQTELGVWDTILDRRIAVPLTFGGSHSNSVLKPEKHIRRVEIALKTARERHTSFYLYCQNIISKEIPRHELRGILQQTLDDQYLPVHFQPIYDLEDGSLKALELLIRVNSKKHGLLLPGQFLEHAQSCGLLTPLTKVCVKMIADNFERLPNVKINLNLPSYMLDNPRILKEFLLTFQQAKLPPKRFCLEVMEDEDIPAEHLLSSVRFLKKLGFSIAMDDFGTGYSSLSRLSMLPFDTVKIDRSLLLAASAGNKAILESTIILIKRLGLSAVVEGVETLEQLALIRLLGADSVQGFLLSKPVDMNQATQLPLNAANIIAEF